VLLITPQTSDERIAFYRQSVFKRFDGSSASVTGSQSGFEVHKKLISNELPT
jgi:hypothetical protein